MVIAVDFDGTIVEHRYPEIGKEIPMAISALKRLQAEGHILVLWSVREGSRLEEAVEFCRSRGLEFYAVNANHPEDSVAEDDIKARKLSADIFIDDRNVGGLPNWGAIYEMISKRCTYEEYLRRSINGGENQPKPGFWARLMGGK